MLHANAGMRRTGLAALVAASAACALFDPPSDETPPHPGLPRGVTASPAGTQAGPATSPTPVTPDLTPAATRQPMGNFVEENTPSVVVDSTTKVLIARLDSAIVGADKDITKMPIPVARGLIAGISAAIGSSRVPRVQAVAGELETLNQLLGESPIDGKKVGRSLQRLSARAANAAPEAGVLAGRVARLADELHEQGTRLLDAP